MTAVEELVNGVVELITLPEIYLRLNQVMDDPGHNAEQLGEVIGLDPALSARVLRIVNSAYYSLAVKVELVSRAVTVLGENELRSLVLATSVVDTFDTIPNQLLNINEFWQHSVYTGIIARILARRCNILHGERLFIAGLLHDIGKLVVYYKEPELSEEVLLQAAENDGVLYRAEQEIIGFTHADVGAALVDVWNLPQMLKEVVQYHHAPQDAENAPIETAIVHIADAVVNALDPGITINEHLLDDMPSFDPVALKIAGLDLDVLPEVLEKADEQIVDVMSIICPTSALRSSQ